MSAISIMYTKLNCVTSIIKYMQITEKRHREAAKRIRDKGNKINDDQYIKHIHEANALKGIIALFRELRTTPKDQREILRKHLLTLVTDNQTLLDDGR